MAMHTLTFCQRTFLRKIEKKTFGEPSLAYV